MSTASKLPRHEPISKRLADERDTRVAVRERRKKIQLRADEPVSRDYDIRPGRGRTRSKDSARSQGHAAENSLMPIWILAGVGALVVFAAVGATFIPPAPHTSAEGDNKTLEKNEGDRSPARPKRPTVASDAPKVDPSHFADAELDGLWVLESAQTAKGKSFMYSHEEAIRIEGSKVSWVKASGDYQDVYPLAEITVNTAKKPKQITFVSNGTVKKWRGIYKIENDKLYIATNLEKDQRPSMFLTQSDVSLGGAHHVRVYKRTQEDDDRPLMRVKIGDYVTSKISGVVSASMTMEVVEATDKDVTIRYSVIINGKSEKPMEVTLPRNLKVDHISDKQANGYKISNLQDGKETLKVNGKEYRCDWKSFYGKRESTKNDAEFKLWTSKDVPIVGLVKTQQRLIVYERPSESPATMGSHPFHGIGTPLTLVGVGPPPWNFELVQELTEAGNKKQTNVAGRGPGDVQSTINANSKSDYSREKILK